MKTPFFAPAAIGLALAALTLGATSSFARDIKIARSQDRKIARSQDRKIAHVYDKTGALEAYAAQTQAGLMLGFDYATQGNAEEREGRARRIPADKHQRFHRRRVAFLRCAER